MRAGKPRETGAHLVIEVSESSREVPIRVEVSGGRAGHRVDWTFSANNADQVMAVISEAVRKAFG